VQGDYRVPPTAYPAVTSRTRTLSEKVREAKVGLEDWMEVENVVIMQTQEFEDAKMQ
jgi:hypothetical protein